MDTGDEMAIILLGMEMVHLESLFQQPIRFGHEDSREVAIFDHAREPYVPLGGSCLRHVRGEQPAALSMVRDVFRHQSEGLLCAQLRGDVRDLLAGPLNGHLCHEALHR